MYDKDVSTCKRVILDIICKLYQKEKKAKFDSESSKYMTNRLTLMKVLDVIKKEKPK
ncbi:hypothetical protein [uncultured Clostridium sp.]|uniref:hypothetical protein n=1 Tax=uncultured Clostridium sp. TaxID=59620 RepID=UPI0026161049|nr:hypothetical protein [uncultured Clostridium sp.]